MSTAKKSVIVIEVIHNDDPKQITYEIAYSLFGTEMNIYQWSDKVVSTEEIEFDTSYW